MRFRDVHNELLLLLQHDPSSPDTLRRVTEQTDGITPALNRKKPMDFYTLVAYLPLSRLLKMDLLRVAWEILREMEQYLSRPRRDWKFSLFLDFTHVLMCWKWRGEQIPDVELMTRYDEVAGSWFRKYGEDTVRFVHGSDWRGWSWNAIAKIDMTLQFMKLRGSRPSEHLERQVMARHAHRGSVQTEHLVMMLMILLN